jgi:hypothetical protein
LVAALAGLALLVRREDQLMERDVPEFDSRRVLDPRRAAFDAVDVESR